MRFARGADFERGAREFWHTVTPVRATEVLRGGNWRPAWGKVIVGTPGILDSNFFNGQAVEMQRNHSSSARGAGGGVV